MQVVSEIVMDRKNLIQRGQIWYLKVTVPRSLVEHIGKDQIVKSLKTADIHEARRKRDIEKPRVLRMFELKRRQIDCEQISKKTKLEEILEQVVLLKDELEDGNLDIQEASFIWEEISGGYVDKKENAGLAIPYSDAVTIRAAGESLKNLNKPLLSDAIKKHIKNMIDRGCQSSTVNTRKVRLERFQRWLQQDPFVCEIKKSSLIEYVYEYVLKEDFSNSTRKYHLTELSTFFNYCKRLDYVETNPAEDLTKLIAESKKGVIKSGKRRPWTSDEILVALNVLIEKDNKALTTITIIGLLTGMRLEEICNIKLKDLGDGFIRTTEGKNDNSLRDVPIHHLLLPLVEKLKQRTESEYLIDGLKRGGQDLKRSHAISKKFGRFLRNKAKISDKGIVFHSLRHTFSKGILDAGVSKTTQEMLMGHRTGSMSIDTYAQTPTLRLLTQAMSKLTYGEKIDNLIEKAINEI